MASISYSISKGQDYSPGSITLGASAPGAGDLEVRINLVPANSVAPFTREEVKIALMKIIDRVEDGNFSELANI